MRKWLATLLLVLFAGWAIAGENVWLPGVGPVRQGDFEIQGSLTVAGDGAGARHQLDINTTAPTYDTGTAGIDITQLATFPIPILYMYDDTTSMRIPIGPTYQTSRIMLDDATLGTAPNASCNYHVYNQMSPCSQPETTTFVPQGQTYVFDKIHFVVTEALSAATEDCTLFFSYGPLHADKAAGFACTDPEVCALSDQVALVHIGPTDPGNAGTALWLSALGDEIELDLEEVEVAGFWRLMVHDRFRCDAASGADQGKPCAADSECAGAGVCDEDAPAACTVIQALEAHVNYWMYE